MPPSLTHNHSSSGVWRAEEAFPSKAAGPDGSIPRLLKACTLELGNPTEDLFNLSLEREGPQPPENPVSSQS
ncbi:uncharacterized protein AKAME5_002578400 [Lates japonicus]|uniref:Uncharacterized protein n=1 Tax=Lates japonicus TaxID=270547 RepID=A0AAD3NL49_LATJO|nr:uncharacterized protein AKAME5_002578400 [Lates japonicus]